MYDSRCELNLRAKLLPRPRNPKNFKRRRQWFHCLNLWVIQLEFLPNLSGVYLVVAGWRFKLYAQGALDQRRVLEVWQVTRTGSLKSHSGTLQIWVRTHVYLKHPRRIFESLLINFYSIKR